MKPSKDLSRLIKNLSPDLHEGEYVFCVVPKDVDIYSIKTVATFTEDEGTTMVLKKEDADCLNLKYQTVMSWITLKVYSSLEAVGLTAVVSDALAKNNISCNVIAAYYHDHIFVQKGDAIRAMHILNELVRTNSTDPLEELK